MHFVLLWTPKSVSTFGSLDGGERDVRNNLTFNLVPHEVPYLQACDSEFSLLNNVPNRTFLIRMQMQTYWWDCINPAAAVNLKCFPYCAVAHFSSLTTTVADFGFNLLTYCLTWDVTWMMGIARRMLEREPFIAVCSGSEPRYLIHHRQMG
jgi:hypothetical protein